MIVDFTTSKRKLDNLITQVLETKILQKAPLLNLVNNIEIQHEGNSAEYQTEEGDVNQVDFKSTSSYLHLTKEEMAKMSFADILKKVDDMAEEIAGKVEGNMFSSLSEAVEKSGNVIPGNPELNPESYLKALEMVPIDFEDGQRDKPHLLSIVCHPSVAKKLQDRMEALSPEQLQEMDVKFKSIIDKKYDEFISREDDRKLVD